ncbi:uncharacterized protein LOC101861988 [Aplysia californica]|uniref:Uncharacterized protein LOC101861988 n=1 Tax=Aplysia californica TaxID=6500 RepID=A0ABM0K4P1_APLCA|nr:uncharacterized protein LOC101861988 [Aplysia californica]
MSVERDFVVPDHVALSLAKSGDLAVEIFLKVLACSESKTSLRESEGQTAAQPLPSGNRRLEERRSEQKILETQRKSTEKRHRTNRENPLTTHHHGSSAGDGDFVGRDDFDRGDSYTLVDGAMRNMQTHLGQISCLCENFFERCPTSRLNAADKRHCGRFHSGGLNQPKAKQWRRSREQEKSRAAQHFDSTSSESEESRQSSSACDSDASVLSRLTEEPEHLNQKYMDLIDRLPYSKSYTMKKSRSEVHHPTGYRSEKSDSVESKQQMTSKMVPVSVHNKQSKSGGRIVQREAPHMARSSSDVSSKHVSFSSTRSTVISPVGARIPRTQTASGSGSLSSASSRTRKSLSEKDRASTASQGVKILTRPGSFVIRKTLQTKDSHTVSVRPGEFVVVNFQDH